MATKLTVLFNRKYLPGIERLQVVWYLKRQKSSSYFSSLRIQKEKKGKTELAV